MAKGPSSLTFACATDGFSVDIVSVRLGGEGQADALGEAYGGPLFGELDPAVQRAFEHYLEVRGVGPELAEYLQELSVDKEQRECVGGRSRGRARTGGGKGG